MFHEYRVLFWSDEDVLELERDGGHTHCECTTYHWMVLFKMVNLCTFILNFKKCRGGDGQSHGKTDWKNILLCSPLRPVHCYRRIKVSEKCSPNSSHPDLPGHLPLERLPIPLNILWKPALRKFIY